MREKSIKIVNFEVANDRPFMLIAGPCQMESREHAFDMCGKLAELTKKLGIPFIYKTSYDKANRTSLKAQRGIGMEKGLEIFGELKKEFGEQGATEVVLQTGAFAFMNRFTDGLRLPSEDEAVKTYQETYGDGAYKDWEIQ